MAVVATEGLLTSVRPNVTLKKPRSRESLSAKVALARQRMRSDVHFQSSSRGVDFSTLVACHCFLNLITFVCSTMELLVLRKSGIGRIGLSTVRTLIARWGRGLFALLRFYGLLNVGTWCGFFHENRDWVIGWHILQRRARWGNWTHRSVWRWCKWIVGCMTGRWR